MKIGLFSNKNHDRNYILLTKVFFKIIANSTTRKRNQSSSVLCIQLIELTV